MFLFPGKVSQLKDIKEFAQSKQGSQDLSSESLNSNPMPAPPSQAFLSSISNGTSGSMLPSIISSLTELKTIYSEILPVYRALSDCRNKYGLVPALTELALWLERQQSTVWNTWVYAVLLCG